MNVTKFAFCIVLGSILGSAVACAQSENAWQPARQWSGTYTKCLNATEQAELLKKAKDGDVQAQDTLGSLYVSTCEGPFDASKGLELLTQAAAHGNAHAQVMLGGLYQNGQQVSKNATAAAAWFAKAAEQNYPQGENDLGMLLMTDLSVKDEARAVKMFRAAAEHGLGAGAFNLATMYDNGAGVSRDYVAARKWYARAAELKNGDAEYRLGMLLEAGLGGKKDQASADEMYKRAADHGSQDAEIKIGRKALYQTTSPNSGYFQFVMAMQMLDQKNKDYDPAKGVKFLEKSAEIGHPLAMSQLGWIYANGQAGVNKDEAKAIQYYQQAIARDPKFAVPLNNYAWILVTSDNQKMHDPQKALDMALKAVALTDGKNGNYVDTLAYAYFELGQVDKAVETETRAAQLSPQSESIKKTLARFQAAKQQAHK